jgi:predicted DNA-binding transcriptional regulator YafY
MKSKVGTATRKHDVQNAPISDLELKIVSAIRERRVVKFIYNNSPRVVEPQTFGTSTTGNPILRGYQVAGASSSGKPRGLRLFEVSKIAALEITNTPFPEARPEHNPQDSAMSKVWISLPLPKRRGM